MLVGCLQVEIATRMCESVAPSTLKWWQHSRPWPERDEERINSARAEIASNYVDRQTDRQTDGFRVQNWRFAKLIRPSV